MLCVDKRYACMHSQQSVRNSIRNTATAHQHKHINGAVTHRRIDYAGEVTKRGRIGMQWRDTRDFAKYTVVETPGKSGGAAGMTLMEGTDWTTTHNNVRDCRRCGPLLHQPCVILALQRRGGGFEFPVKL